MYEPTEFEEFECLVKSKSCSYGICSECTIGIGKSNGGPSYEKEASCTVNGRFVDKSN